MTFLNPAILFGLFSAVIPLVLHLFNLRKLRTIEFSTLAFLKELQKSKIRRVKIRQWLLLLLRTLLILLIVLAFSRPTLRGSLPGVLAERAKTTAVILIDDSPSMTASDTRGEYLKQAVKTGEIITNVLQDGDEVYLGTLSGSRSGTMSLPPAQKNLFSVRSSLREIKSSFLHRTLEDALQFSAGCLASSRNLNQELYIISDFKNGLLPAQTSFPGATFSPAVQCFLISIGDREFQNISIDTLSILNSIFEVHKSFTVAVHITNHAPTAVKNHLASLVVDGTRTAQKGFDLEAGQSTTMEFAITPKHAGPISGMVELEDDELVYDNQRFFTVNIPAEIHVAFISPSADAPYLQMAINTQRIDSTASILLRETSLDRLSTDQLEHTDVILLADPYNIDAAGISKLKSFSANGGGIIIFPGGQTDVAQFNTYLASGLRISKMLPMEQRTETSAGFIEFQSTDLRHPIFQGMFEAYNSDLQNHAAAKQPFIESPHITHSVKYQVTPRSHIVISLSNGYPFLIDEQTGAGHVLLFSVAALPEWSDFPLKGLFIPLLHRSLGYLASPQPTNHALFAGDEFTSMAHTTAPSVHILRPNHESVLVHTTEGDRFFRFTQTDIPGNYAVMNGTSVSDMFSVNIDPAESYTKRADENQLKQVLRRWKIPQDHIHTIDDGEAAERSVLQARFGTELWRYILMLALFVAIVESLVARETKKELASLYSHAE